MTTADPADIRKGKDSQYLKSNTDWNKIEYTKPGECVGANM